MTTKNTRWFTTLSLLNEKHLDVIHSICKKNWKVYLIITEKGSTGTNFHYHIYFESSQYSRGTMYNEYFKPIYHKDNIKITIKTIHTKTVPDKRKDFLSYYFFKEKHNTPETTHHSGIPEQEMEEIFLNRVLAKPKRRVLRYNEAPYILYEICKKEKYILNSVCESVMITQVRQLLREAMSEGYIVHHLYQKMDSLANAIYDIQIIDTENAVDIVEPEIPKAEVQPKHNTKEIKIPSCKKVVKLKQKQKKKSK